MNPIIGFFSLLFAAIGAIIFSGGPLGTVGTAVGGVIGFFSLPLAFIFAKVFFWRGINKIRQIRNQLKKPTGFCIAVGKGTGIFFERGHKMSPRKGNDIYLSLPDMCQNVVVFGGIGSGKTTRIIQPFLSQILAQKCGALIFDIKGDFGGAVQKVAGANNKQVTTIGVGKTPLNLLKGLTPEMSSSFLSSALLLGGGKGDAFWTDTATELCKNALGVLNFVPRKYSLVDLYLFLFAGDFEQKKIMDLARRGAEGNDRNERLLNVYETYINNVYGKFDDKVKQGVMATVAQVLSPFQHPDLADYFCSDRPDAANLEDVLSGKVYLVDLPLSTWGTGAKIVYTMIKLRLFNVLQSRQSRAELDQNTPVAFICDEYQEIISASKSGLSDLNFWDKSRSAKCIGLISSQSVASFRAAVGGNQVLADTVLSNFRQKFCFRTEDISTLEYLNKMIGEAEVWRESTSETSSKTDSTSKSLSLQNRSVVDAQVMRQLGQNQAVAVLQINNISYDDVVELVPLFL